MPWSVWRAAAFRRRRDREGIGLATRRTPRTCSRRSGQICSGDSFLGRFGCPLLSASILTSASASTQTTILPDCPHHAVDGASARPCRSRSPRSPDLSDPNGVNDRNRCGVGGVLRRVHRHQPQSCRSALIGSVGLMIASLLRADWLRVRLVLPRPLTRNTVTSSCGGWLCHQGGVMLLVIFGYGLKQYAAPDCSPTNDNNVTIFRRRRRRRGRYRMVLGLVLAQVIWRFMAPPFFQGDAGRRHVPDPETAVDEAAAVAHFGLPTRATCRRW